MKTDPRSQSPPKRRPTEQELDQEGRERFADESGHGGPDNSDQKPHDPDRGERNGSPGAETAHRDARAPRE